MNMMRVRGHLALLVMSICALLVWSACGKSKGSLADEEAEQKIKPMAVETMQVSMRSFVQTIEFPGVAEPVETRRVSAESSGRVLAAPFEEGKEVQKGDLLLRTDAKVTRAQMKVIDAQISTARREHNRIRELASQGLATPQQLDQSKSQLQQAQLSRKQVAVGASMSTVRSPFRGFVHTKFIKQGEFIGPGQPIVELINYSTVILNVTVPESDLGALKLGDKVEVHFPSIKKSYEGVVKKRGLRVVQPTQTFPVEVHVLNTDLELVPGMRAYVRVPKISLKDVVVIPRDAVLEGFSRREAMVVEHEGDVLKASLRVVELGPSKENLVVVRGGLKVGDKLIVRGHRNVVHGTLLRVVRELKALPQTAHDLAPKTVPPKAVLPKAVPQTLEKKEALEKKAEVKP